MIIPEQRRSEIAAAIVTLQERGEAPTNDAVYAAVGGARKFVTTFMKQWRAEQRTADTRNGHAAVEASAPIPVPRPAPVSRLVELQQQVAEAEETWRDLEQQIQVHQRDLGRLRAEYRNAHLEAQQLTRQVRQAVQMAALPVYQGHEDVQWRARQLRQRLAALVGEEEVQRVQADGGYMPWWLTAR